jgi:hypothetical protein
MPTAKTIAWIERLIWILIYVGLFAVVLGLAACRTTSQPLCRGC